MRHNDKKTETVKYIILVYKCSISANTEKEILVNIQNGAGTAQIHNAKGNYFISNIFIAGSFLLIKQHILLSGCHCLDMYCTIHVLIQLIPVDVLFMDLHTPATEL